jgi:molybdopterin converting factor small subunit
MSASAPPSISVRVLLFASYAQRFGSESLPVRLPASARVADVVAYLRALPGGDQIPPRPLCARNLSHAALSDPVSEGDEVAILPPLAGG